MNTNLNTAKRCFAENLNMFGNAHTQPENYNLYNGLINLADGIEDLHKHIAELHLEIKLLQSQLKR